ncbi:hypothetical protein [Methylobacterium sp. WL120]|uniref:hypothetical protein n=1 Tax=Methylobacterium sp. WL120 TaxID=2603887 RepID=UPI0011CA179A|nr:hypothetical protein [Methylobacterium sp. WL120]TXM64416.1 hypothetical protein FV229_18695 [Methylobacterium sp. WL120]
MAASVILSEAQALAPGKAVHEPMARSTVYGRRYAVLVAPGPALSGATATADLYVRKLRQLGFILTTIGPSRRFDADAAIRDLSNLPAGSEVALFVVGRTYARDESDIFILPEDSSPNAIADSTALPTEALSFGLILRTLKKSRPSQFVGIVTNCQRLDDPRESCSLARMPGAEGVSLISAQAGETESDHEASFARTLTGLMSDEGLVFSGLFARLGASVERGVFSLRRSPEISTSFAFAPARYFSTLDTPCNNLGEGVLSLSDARARVSACHIDEQRFDNARHFATANLHAREQLAFAETDEPCGPTFQAAADRYRSAYPFRTFEAEFERRVAACNRPAPTLAPSRTRFVSQTGWSYDYDSMLLYVSPDGHDVDEAPKTQVSTVFHSRDLGATVVIYVQVLANVQCVTPENYLRFGKVGKRSVSVTYSEASTTPPLGYYGWALKSRGIKLPNQPVQEVTSIDIVTTRLTSRNQFLHVGGRFPPAQASVYEAEVLKIWRSMMPPQNDFYRVTCAN